MSESNPQITIEMFGGLRVRREGEEPVEFLPQHSAELLALLALDIAHEHNRDELTDRLWPEDDVETARQRLRHCLHRLRRQFEQPPIARNDLLIATRTAIRINPDGLTTDVGRFESDLRSAAREADPARRLVLEGAIRIYDGGLVPGFRADCFAAPQARLAELQGSALVALSQEYEQANDLLRAIECALQAVAHDPLLEEARCALMRLSSAMGQPSAVLKHFQEWERVLKKELDEEPSQETRRLMETLRQQAQAKAAEHSAGVPDPGPPAPRVPTPDDPPHVPAKGRRNRLLRPALLTAGLLLLSCIITWRIVAIRRPGDALWIARYEPAPDEANGGTPVAMAVDEQGNIYIAGSVFTKNNDADILTLKYAPNGNLLWRQRYNGPSNGTDQANGIAIDRMGNVYVLGESDTDNFNGPTQASRREIVVLKYDRSGAPSPTWADTGAGAGVRRYRRPFDLEVHASKTCVNSTDGSVFVLGNSFVGRNPGSDEHCREEWVALKFGWNGNLLWERRERGFSDSAGAGAEDIAVDRAGNAIVTGYSKDNSRPGDIHFVMTLKYGSDGQPIWNQTFRDRQFGDCISRKVALDAAGNIYVTAEADTGPVSAGGQRDDIVTIKYDANGKKMWSRPFDFNHLRDWPRGLVVDAAGNVSIAGMSGTAAGTPWDYVTLRYDTRGNLLWTAPFNGGGGFPDYLEDIAFDSQGNVIVAAQFLDGNARTRGTKRFAFHTVKHAPDGRRLWESRYDDGGHNAEFNALAVDRSDNVIVTGACGDGNGATQITTIKYKP